MTISAELVQDAETQLLKFARGHGSSIFSLTIVRANDKWIVSSTDNESGAYCIGGVRRLLKHGTPKKIKYSPAVDGR